MESHAQARVADELAIQRLISAYNQLVDDARFIDVAELFAADGAFENRGTRIGRADLVAFFHEVQVPERRGRHSCGFAVVDFDGPDDARAATDFIFYGRADGAFFLKFAGRYNDTLRRGPAGWCFVTRRVAYIDPNQSGAPQ